MGTMDERQPVSYAKSKRGITYATKAYQQQNMWYLSKATDLLYKKNEK